MTLDTKSLVALEGGVWTMSFRERELRVGFQRFGPVLLTSPNGEPRRGAPDHAGPQGCTVVVPSIRAYAPARSLTAQGGRPLDE
jgi:hypothetical protein